MVLKELQLPVCALIFSVLLCIIYFSRKRIKTTENKLYCIMLLMGTIDSLILTTERFLVRNGNINSVTPYINLILQITNKIDYMALIIISSCLFIYTLLITLPKIKKHISFFIKIISIIDFLIFILMMFLNVNLITSNNIISVSGGPIIPAFITCGIYILLSIFITLFNLNKLNKKHIPIISIIFIFVFLMFVFKNDPYIMVISISITFVNYLMYFTIENPDLKMINQLLRNKELVEEQMEDKSNFLFEMNQSIKGPSKNILELTKVYEKLENEIDKKDLIRTIGVNANELIFRMNNIFDVSQMDVSKIKIIDDEYDINSLIDEVKLLIKNRIDDKNIKFNVKVNRNIPNRLFGDKIRLKQVLMSLIINSVNSMNSGEINLTIDSIVRYDVVRLIIKIEDTGKGMSLDEINDILSYSKELDYKSIERLDTLDVGIKSTIKIIKLLNGNINIRSSVGNGTIIDVIIDQKYKLNELSEIEKSLEKYQSDVYGRKRVLIVGDDKEEIFKIKNFLSNYSLDINFTMIGKECIDRIRIGEIYNLIIIDDELTNDSALNILKNLKKMNNEIPVVVMLNKNKDHFKDIYLSDGFKDYILKENLKNELKRIIDKYL